MKKFIVRLLLFCLLPLPALYLFAYIVDTGLKRSHHYYYSEWNDLFSGKINADVIILGSSRAWVQVSPAILDSMLHVNSYNLGMDGSPFQVQYERFKMYWKYNKKPKYILQEVNFSGTLGKYDKLPGVQQFLPYIDEPSVWKMVTTTHDPLGYLDKYFPLYKYNNEMPLIKEGVLSYFGRGMKGFKYKGYEGQEKSWDGSFEDFQKANPNGASFPIDPDAFNAFREYLAYCKDNGIKVILFYPPAYIESLNYIKNQKEILDALNNFSREFAAPFYNYAYDSLNYSKTNFYNSMHLNKHGAERFTAEFATDLKKDIK